MKATTDSENIVKYDTENKPRISNLLNIASSLTKRTIADLENEFANSGYGVFKSYVADITINFISEMQKKYNEILNSEELNIILDEGRDKTRELAKKNLN